MDKYTVDLDKVLNDFEYSELTEQVEHHRPSVEARATTAATKHSINNVFSSLNDYLNTEIADHSKSNKNPADSNWSVPQTNLSYKNDARVSGVSPATAVSNQNAQTVSDFEKYSSDVIIQSSIQTATGSNQLVDQNTLKNMRLKDEMGASLVINDLNAVDNNRNNNKQLGGGSQSFYESTVGEIDSTQYKTEITTGSKALIEFSPEQEHNKLIDYGPQNVYSDTPGKPDLQYIIVKQSKKDQAFADNSMGEAAGINLGVGEISFENVVFEQGVFDKVVTEYRNACQVEHEDNSMNEATTKISVTQEKVIDQASDKLKPLDQVVETSEVKLEQVVAEKVTDVTEKVTDGKNSKVKQEEPNKNVLKQKKIACKVLEQNKSETEKVAAFSVSYPDVEQHKPIKGISKHQVANETSDTMQLVEKSVETFGEQVGDETSYIKKVAENNRAGAETNYTMTEVTNNVVHRGNVMDKVGHKENFKDRVDKEKISDQVGVTNYPMKEAADNVGHLSDQVVEETNYSVTKNNLTEVTEMSNKKPKQNNTDTKNSQMSSKKVKQINTDNTQVISNQAVAETNVHSMNKTVISVSFPDSEPTKEVTSYQDHSMKAVALDQLTETSENRVTETTEDQVTETAENELATKNITVKREKVDEAVAYCREMASETGENPIKIRLRSQPPNKQTLVVKQSELDQQNTSLEAVIADLEATEDVTVVGFSSALNMEEEELQNYLETLEAELEKSDAIFEEATGGAQCEDAVHCETVNDRPNSLQISGTGENSKREINLIGNPGSTPYNNLYVSKEIPAEKPSHYESESSTSVSPTFSEASTESVRSSDSTDSENEGAKAVATAGSSDAANANEQPTLDDSEDVYVDIDALTAAAAAAGDSAAAEKGHSEEEDAQNLWLGKRAPLWIPDADAINCLHCEQKFTVIKRRHHCRACGLVLCSKCCNSKHRLDYLEQEARVCTKCHDMLSKDTLSSSGSEISSAAGNSPRRLPAAGQPNPNNPMEYCSVVPPMQQMSSSGDAPPTVMVPVGVLKRTGSNKTKHNKSVMFCDGIRPGSDLTNLDNDFNYNETKTAAAVKQRPPAPLPAAAAAAAKINRNAPVTDPNTKSFIPENENCLPPTVTTFKSDTTYTDCANNANVVEMLKNETLTFALQRNLHIHVRLMSMECCINKQAWCFSTEGLIAVGQDEIVILLEYIDNERMVPKDVFYHLNNVYNDAIKGSTVAELGISMHPTTNFLDSKNHAGFIYVRPTYQCLQNVIVPKESYLVGILVHRWETPWAKLFPLRLVLRLGAEYRYYPTPLISSRHRDSVFVEIGHTIINLLADFRNFSYSLPNIRGLNIHMEEKVTTVTIPANRYDQVMKVLNNSSDHILAFGGNFSSTADSHLVCIQDTQGNNENNYTTHIINIQNKPRKVTGASFIVFNGALKSSSGLTAKSSIVEDGLMIQIPAEHMLQVRDSLRNMKNHTIQCGCVNAASDETVSIVWGEPDVNFNVGLKSSVDEQPLSGVPSIRVHKGKDYVCNSGGRLIRWTEVFLLQSGEENARMQDPVDISKVAESISKATCQALVKYLDLLATNNFYKIGIRTTLHVENVSYSAGSNGIKLPPIYMKSLDNELVPVLHRITSNSLGDSAIILELVFRILNV